MAAAVTQTLDPNVGQQSHYHVVCAATTNATLLKAGPASVGAVNIANVAAAARFVKLYDKATAPNPATDVPVRTFMVPAGANFSPYIGGAGLKLAKGLGFAIVTGIADNNVTAPAAADVAFDITYA
jgi:hypothetical protein